MFATIVALFFRIMSNPIANAVQKALVSRHSAILINVYSYLILSIVAGIFFVGVGYDVTSYSVNFWAYVFLAGFLCSLGSVCLIKALQCGEMSVLGPINSYKCLVGLIFGYVLLGEVPSIKALIGVLFIICGSWFIFDTVEKGANIRVLLRKDIMLRFCALFLTGAEAAVLKKIILISSVEESFMFWCFSGLVFSIILMFLFRIKLQAFSRKDFGYIGIISLCLGLMQFSTNVVFKHLDVGLSLALFQLSSIVAVIMGYKLFKETHIFKKLVGALVMILGSCLILL